MRKPGIILLKKVLVLWQNICEFLRSFTNPFRIISYPKTQGFWSFNDNIVFQIYRRNPMRSVWQLRTKYTSSALSGAQLSQRFFLILENVSFSKFNFHIILILNISTFENTSLVVNKLCQKLLSAHLTINCR